MKKKIIISISTILVLIVSALALASCATTNDLTKFYAKASASKKITIERYNIKTGEIFQKSYINDKDRYEAYYDEDGKTIIAQFIVMNEDDKSVVYAKAAEKGELLFKAILPNETFEKDKWFRSEKGDALAYIDAFAYLPSADMILDGAECPKCVGKKIIEERVLNLFEERKVDFKNVKDETVSETRYYLQYEDNGVTIKEENSYLKVNGNMIELYVKDSLTEEGKFEKQVSYKLSAGKIKLPHDAAQLKP